jgi:hypothetical protein
LLLIAPWRRSSPGGGPVRAARRFHRRLAVIFASALSAFPTSFILARRRSSARWTGPRPAGHGLFVIDRRHHDGGGEEEEG